MLDKLENPGITTQGERWSFFTDRVMGGLSEGQVTVSNQNNTTCYKMTGNVTTENNGGFIQVRTKITNHPNDKQFLGVRIKVRGNDEKYSIHLRTKYLLFPWQYYYSTFTATSQWETIDLKFSEFQKSNF